MTITVNDAWYWGDRRVAWMADGKMFTIARSAPWAQHLIAQGLVREPVPGDQVLMDMAGL